MLLPPCLMGTGRLLFVDTFLGRKSPTVDFFGVARCDRPHVPNFRSKMLAAEAASARAIPRPLSSISAASSAELGAWDGSGSGSGSGTDSVSFSSKSSGTGRSVEVIESMSCGISSTTVFSVGDGGATCSLEASG